MTTYIVSSTNIDKNTTWATRYFLICLILQCGKSYHDAKYNLQPEWVLKGVSTTANVEPPPSNYLAPMQQYLVCPLIYGS